MKKLQIILLIAFLNAGFAQNYSEHYYKRKAQFENSTDTKNEIIFLGNSITEAGKWKILFPNKNVVNRGISGDVTDGILLRLDEVTSSRPDKVFLLIGTNDMAKGKDVDYVLENIEKIILKVREDSNKTELFLQSILPINPNVTERFPDHKRNHQNILEANKRLKLLAKTYNIKYINLHRVMRNAKKHLKTKYTYDGLHLTEEAYKEWGKKISKYVN